MISERIVSAINPICPIYASDAEVRTAPYATYNIEEETLYDKDGPWARRASVTILMIATSYDEADSIADDAIEAINALRSDMLISLGGREPYESTDAKLFAVELSYTITEEIE